MNTLGRSLIRLYPAHWRARYGEEFEALIEDSSPGWRATFDLLKGAIRMQFSMPSFPKLAVILSLLGLVVGLGVSMVVTPRYVSTGVLHIFSDPNPSTLHPNLREHLIQTEQEVSSRTSLAAIIQDPRLDLYREERRHMPLEDVIERMRRDIEIRRLPSGSDYASFTISFAYSDRFKAQQTVQALITKFVYTNLVMQRSAAQPMRITSPDQTGRLEARIAVIEKRLGIASPPAEPPETFPPVYGGVKLKVLDVPSLPTHAVYPNRAIFMAAGFGAGFVSALAIAVFRRRPPPLPFPARTA